MDNITRMEIIYGIVDIFDDFLEEKGIKIPSSEIEKLENGVGEEGSTIFGTDFGNLASKVDDFLIDCKLLDGGSHNEFKDADFFDDEEKMVDFKNMSKKDFQTSYSYLTEDEYNNTRMKYYKEMGWIE